MRARTDAGGPLAILQFPDIGLDLAVAGNTCPKDVASAVAGKVAHASEFPGGAGVCAQIDAGRPLPVDDLPLVHIASGGILPKNAARTIAREISDTDHLIASGVSAWTDAGGPLAILQ